MYIQRGLWPYFIAIRTESYHLRRFAATGCSASVGNLAAALTVGI